MKTTLMNILAAAAIALSVVACGSNDVPVPRTDAEGNPVQTQAQSSGNHGGSDMLLGGVMGYMAGRLMSPSQPPSSHVVERTVIREVPATQATTHSKPKYEPMAPPKVSSVPSPNYPKESLHTLSNPHIYSPSTPSKPNIYSSPSPSRNTYSGGSRSYSSGRR